MQNIEKQVKKLYLSAQKNKQKYIKRKSNLSKLTKAIDLILDKFNEHGKQRREKETSKI